MKRYKNTFGPPHLTNEWITLEQILHGIPLGVFKYEDLPNAIKNDLDAYLEKMKNKQKTVA